LADVLPLSPLQEGLLFHAVYDESALDVYLVQTVVGLSGRVDVERLRVALRGVLERYGNLRAGFRYVGLSRPVQVVPREVVVPPVVEVDLSDVGEAGVAAFLLRDRACRFELARPPLWRCALLRLGAEEYRLVLTCHHILGSPGMNVGAFSRSVDLWSAFVR
jgi:hypothetical protein